jgi:hypothetical protein
MAYSTNVAQPAYSGARNYVMVVNGEQGRILKEAALCVWIYPAIIWGSCRKLRLGNVQSSRDEDSVPIAYETRRCLLRRGSVKSGSAVCWPYFLLGRWRCCTVCGLGTCLHDQCSDIFTCPVASMHVWSIQWLAVSKPSWITLVDLKHWEISEEDTLL